MTPLAYLGRGVANTFSYSLAISNEGMDIKQAIRFYIAIFLNVNFQHCRLPGKDIFSERLNRKKALWNPIGRGVEVGTKCFMTPRMISLKPRAITYGNILEGRDKNWGDIEAGARRHITRSPFRTQVSFSWKLPSVNSNLLPFHNQFPIWHQSSTAKEKMPILEDPRASFSLLDDPAPPNDTHLFRKTSRDHDLLPRRYDPANSKVSLQTRLHKHRALREISETDVGHESKNIADRLEVFSSVME